MGWSPAGPGRLLTWLAGQAVDSRFAEFYPIPPTPARAWIYLDGAYVLRTSAQSVLGLPAAVIGAPAKMPADPFEVSFNVTDSGGGIPEFRVHSAGGDDDPTFGVSYSKERLGVDFAEHSVNSHKSFGVSFSPRPVPDPSSRLNVHILVDPAPGLVEVFLDGKRMFRTGDEKTKPYPGFVGAIYITARQTSGFPMILSDIRIDRRNGNSSEVAQTRPRITLTNSDSAEGDIVEIHDEKVVVESDIGRVEILLAQVHAVEFGNKAAPVRAAGRIRLCDGSVIHVDAFEFTAADGVVAHSSVLGDLRLPPKRSAN